MQRVGRYEVVAPLGRGGMGVVFRARDPATERDVALKLLVGLGSAHQRKRFQREAEALARVAHPHVVRLFDVDQTPGGEPYLVMELVEGESLQARLEREGPCDPDRAVAYARALCGAVQACHDAGVLHRDLKPDNVLVTREGALKLIDFGLVRDTDPATSRTQLSAHGQFLGSPGYWAPEQAAGELEAIGPATDVYGIGATLYGLLTGAPPHPGESLVEVLEAARQPKPPPSRRNPAVPRWLDAVVLRALAVDPGERYPSAQALGDALAPPVHAGARAPAGAAAAGLVLALAGLLVAGGLLARHRARAPAVASMAGRTDPASSPPVTRSDSSPSDSDPEHTALEARGKALGLEGRLEEASAAYTAALAQRECPECRYFRGRALEYLTRFPEAIADYDRAIELAPAAPHGYMGRGQVRLATHAWELALSDLERALERGESLDETTGESLRRLVFLAQIALVVGDPEAPWPRPAIPPAAEARLQDGLACAQRRDWAGALAAYDAALALCPTYMLAHLNRGLARAALGDREGALADYARALAFEPLHARAHYERGTIHVRQARWAEALLDFTRVIEIEPNAAAYQNRGSVRLELEDPRGAIEDYSQGIELDPDFPDLYVNRAQVHARLGAREHAARDYEQALRLAPDAAWAQEVRRTLEALRAQGE